MSKVDECEEALPDNVIVCHFGELVYNDIFHMIKFEGGIKRTEKKLLEHHDPRWVKGVMRKLIRERGW